MSSIVIAAAGAALTANGGSDGFVTVASNALFYPGATLYLSSSTVAGRLCLVTELSSTDKVGLRFIDKTTTSGIPAGPQYGRDDCSAYLTANNARIDQPQQTCRVNANFTKIDHV